MHSLKESYKRQMNKKKKPNHTNDIKVEWQNKIKNIIFKIGENPK
jgi:hypothetical protein